LDQAKAALAEQENLLSAAQEQVDAAKAVKDAADEVAQILAGKKPGKKIKFTKKEKKVMKEDKKEAKKQAKEDKKNEKQKVKDEKKAAKQIKKDAKKAGKNTSPEKTAFEQQAEATQDVSSKASAAAKPKTKAPTAKAPAAKKPVAKQPRAKKVAPAEAAASAEAQTQSPMTEPKDLEPTQANLPGHITTENTPEGTSAEPAASETGKDLVVETQVVPPAEIAPEESAQEENLDKPTND
jgi:hypothetical protein